MEAADSVLALSGRWGLWQEALEAGVRAAQAQYDRKAEAWAFHQLGTRAMGLGAGDAARKLLESALQIRESIGDEIGAAFTRHNLNVLGGAAILPPRGGAKSRGWAALSQWFGPLLVVGAGGILLLIGSLLLLAIFRPPPPVTEMTETATVAVSVAPSQTASATATETPVPPSDTPTPSATPTAPTGTSTIVHRMRPGDPSGFSSFITDRSSLKLGSQRRALGDNFEANLLERPFSSGGMAYRGFLDIIRAEILSAPPWIYVSLTLEGTPSRVSGAAYCVEIDLDSDGRGDWLICGEAPSSSAWTVSGVSAYRDTNNDVGGSLPMRAEVPTRRGDGYEERVFFQGRGADPDAAWIRSSPTDASRIQIAFKHALIGFKDAFVWGVWSDCRAQECKTIRLS